MKGYVGKGAIVLTFNETWEATTIPPRPSTVEASRTPSILSRSSNIVRVVNVFCTVESLVYSAR